MIRKSPTTNDLLACVIEHIDIPESLYDKAAARHRSLGEFLKRDSSGVKHFDPDIRPQGSFRFGTVTRPIFKDDKYDLDNVCVLTKLGKSDMTQQELKELYGAELREYARQNNMLSPLEECNRCWRLHYADEVSFHLDSLPSIPEEYVIIEGLRQAGVPEDLARLAIAITDRRHLQYSEKTRKWPSSNPRGFAAWFEQQAALGRPLGFSKEGVLATIEDVPPYRWKTPLQRSIQILKRHRDVMFRDNRDLAPISMIITNLAAHAYGGENDLFTALTNIVAKMSDFVRDERPRVPNPADPAEDYADKWTKDPRLERNFWSWHSAVKSDVAKLPGLLGSGALSRETKRLFDVTLTGDEEKRLTTTTGPVVIATATPTIVTGGSKPWGIHG